MSQSAVCVIFKTKPGKRDELKASWEKYIKPHVIDNDNINQNIYSFSLDDPDTVCMFEILSDINVLTNAYEQPWMKEYLAVIASLLLDKPQVLRLDPIWMKKKI
jgi:quinol monooxygenase YgiN